jgi:hypothetical protein
MLRYRALGENYVNAHSVLLIYSSATPYRYLSQVLRGNLILNATSLYSGNAFLLYLDPDPHSKCRSGRNGPKPMQKFGSERFPEQKHRFVSKE